MIRDHLGNNRVFFWDSTGNNSLSTNEIRAVKSYYPFGMDMRQTNNTNKEFKYGFGDNEEVEYTGYSNFGFRCLDPTIGRWLSTDPLSELAPDLTPFRYGFNNPISYTDPFGLFESRREARKYRKSSDDQDIRKGKVKKEEDGSYSVRFGESGKISKDFFGNLEFSSTATFTGASISQYDPNIFERIERSNFLGRVAVGFVDDLWLTVQSFNPFDTRVTHLSGNFAIGDEAIMGLINSTATAVPLGRSTTTVKSLAPQGLTILGKLNAAQFSKMFKGTTLSRANPRVRGKLNRLINSSVDISNGKVQTGNVIFNITKVSGKSVNKED